MAAYSYMYDSAAATRVARDNVRDLRIRNWPGATRSLPMEFPDRLNRELLDFVAAHDPPDPDPATHIHEPLRLVTGWFLQTS